jgi:hypothetical protein
VIKLLDPFIVTSVHAAGNNVADMEPDARQIFTESELSRDPNRLNVFLFMLDETGKVVHESHGVPGGRRGGPDRADWSAEITKALAKLNLPDAARARLDRKPCGSLPDLAASAADVPAGVRIFVRQGDTGNAQRGRLPIVEVAPMKPHEWEPLAFSAESREIPAELLKNWLVWLYPAAIRTADESKRFRDFTGTLRLEPACSDEHSRTMLLSGKIHLGKGDESLSAFDGDFEAVLTYRPDKPDVQSVLAVVDGVYLYRQRGTNPQPLKATIESRPSREVSSKPARKSQSPEELRAEIEAMRAEKVAWREIAWTPCLLDGLKASREQGKPALLWIFIDRPADDARC